MKNRIIYFAATLLLGASLLGASCSTDDTKSKTATDPNYPTAITTTIPTGGEYELEIEPNLDWELRIPFSGDAAKWFFIKDGSQQAYKVQGSAGAHTITICAQDQAEYDAEYVCEVTLKMWDSAGNEYSRVVATIKTGKTERSLKIYACEIVDGDFAYATEEDRNQGLTQGHYGTEPTEQIELLWPTGKNSFSMPIMVDANFKWNVISELPAWISDLTVSGGKGDRKIDFRISGNGRKYPLDGASAELLFGDSQQSYPVTVSIPACRDIYNSEFGAETKFNHLGHIMLNSNYQEGKAQGTITSAPGLVFYKLMEITQYGNTILTDQVDMEWLTIEDSWLEDEDVVQGRRVYISAASNLIEPSPWSTSGDPRKAIVLALPATVAATIEYGEQLTDGAKIAPEYEKYIVTTIMQLGDQGPVTASEDEKYLFNMGAQFKKVPKSDSQYSWLKGEFNALHIYRQTYINNWSDEDWKLLFADGYTSYKCFNYNAGTDTFDELTGNNNWLSFGNNIIMKPRMSAVSEGAVVFYNATGVAIATIHCIFDPNADIAPDEEEGDAASFVYPDIVQNATLTKVDENSPLYTEWAEYLGMGIPVYHLAYTGNPMTAMLKVPTFNYIFSAQEWLSYEGDASGFSVYMDSPTSASGSMMLYNGTTTVLILVCTIEK